MDAPADFHVHTRWSLDVVEGPGFEDYCQTAAEVGLVVGFLDHYELLYADDPRNPLCGDALPAYLEEVDDARANWRGRAAFGLEVDYYPQPERVAALREFVDDFGREFDLLVGSLHEVEDHGPVTVPGDLARLAREFPGGFPGVVERYFELQLDMVRSGLFGAIAHPDVVFRYCGDVVPHDPDSLGGADRTRATCLECARRGIVVEVNLGGLSKPAGRQSPPEALVVELAGEGVKFFVGSDSHSVGKFRRAAPVVRRTAEVLEELGAMGDPRSDAGADGGFTGGTGG
ncbi:MAG: histidinol-phosphatase HisJ family protein [Promethearchaeota archaeon]